MDLSKQKIHISLRTLRLLGEYKYPNSIKIVRKVYNVKNDNNTPHTHVYGQIKFDHKLVDVKRPISDDSSPWSILI